ncbi:MAG: radical SAM family heme chaperone HemW [Candidatus Omnitrophica bacterium]|nr:radical SAM family heme chaperone HemW [Candidatus Omnitrophota bacterium]
MKKIGIYIHIPFCIKKCSYCDFYSVRLKNRKEIKDYCDALKKDIEFFAKKLRDYSVKTVYFGGGTPSLLTKAQAGRIIQKVRADFSVEEKAEITLEANPATLTGNKLKGFKKAGVNRVSLGVQSFSDKFLKILGRAHKAKDALNSIELLRKAEFDNISIDLIYGLPEQDLDDWKAELDNFIALGIEHISFYDLKIEKGTPFYKIRKDLKVPDEYLQAKMYKIGCHLLESAGYLHYEISSFAKKGKESQHNQLYWKNEEYLGIGAGAYSYLKGARFCRIKNINKYQDEVRKNDIKRYHPEKLDKNRRLAETLILNLRLLKGVNLENIEKRCSSLFSRNLLEELNKLNQEKLLVKARGNYRLSNKGILFYDTVSGYILSNR